MIENFIKEVEGKAFDTDKVAGVQCVDGIKEFAKRTAGSCEFNCGNGWANGLFLNYGSNGVEKYFEKLDYKEVQKGDFVVWDKGSKEAPNSHVAMFIEKVDKNHIKVFGQRQNGIKEFNYATVDTNGIMGVLRSKKLIEESKKENKEDKENISKADEELLILVKRTIRGDFGNGKNRELILGKNYDKVQKQVNKNLKSNLTSWDNIKLFK